MDCYRRTALSLWAKKDEISGRLCWLPLIVHLEDTMNVARWLWNNWISDGQREFCTKSIQPANEETALNLAGFLGAVHDIGKATPAFQIQKGYRNSPDLDDMLLEKLEQAGFHGISSFELADLRKTHHSLAGEYLLQEKFYVKSDIGSIVGGHHGKPVDDAFEVTDQSAYAQNYYQSEDRNSDIRKRWESVQEYIFQWALEKSGFESVNDLPEVSLPAQAIYSGLLIMADWIASNSDYFSLFPVEFSQTIDLQMRFQSGIQQWGGRLPLQVESVPSVKILFHSRFNFEPRNFQTVTCQATSQIYHPGIIVLEAPMGLGKTETALAVAEEIACKTGSSGLFFGLPTQATSNSMFGRVHAWLENLLKDYPGASQSLRLCHGKAALNEEMSRLERSRVPGDINVDETANESVFVNEWFSGRKKAALDDFVVGTVDSFLLTALKQKHLALRHLGFSKKVVIIDEVHAYDAYMQQYLEEALEWMGAYGTPVILVSATLPDAKRRDLITAYLKGTGVKKREMEFPKQMFENRYPLVSYTDGKSIKTEAGFEVEYQREVQVKRLEEKEVMSKIAELWDGGGVIGVIVNTVKRAQSIGKACKECFGSDNVEILHSAFIATDRARKEAELTAMIGKNGIRPKRKIIIGTQVIEQSLDIDFDVIVTDLCPIDLLIQRIGRLHRHLLKRPDMHRVPTVYVMGMNDRFEFEKGSVYIYGKYFLIRTQCFLPDKIVIPRDIAFLVNKVYGDQKPDLAKELENIYFESRSLMEIQKNNKEEKARCYRIDPPKRRIDPENNNLLGKLKDPDESASEEIACAQVRDICETIEVVALQKVGDGYGVFGGKRDLSGEIGVAEWAKKLSRETIRLQNYGIMHNSISKTIEELEKYTRKWLKGWQNQPWLRGELGIIFDEEGQFEMDGMKLIYDQEYGLQEESEDGKV